MKKITLLTIILLAFTASVVFAQEVTFTKEDGADWTLEENQDRITDNVWLTRGNGSGGLFNAVSETEYEKDESPLDTEWVMGSTYDIDPADYTYFADAHGESASSLPGETMSLHLITDDLYFDVLFNSWTSGGDGVSYTRTSITKYLKYSSTIFQESSANDGSIQNSLTINMTLPDGDSFTGSNGVFAAGKYTANNVPAGLTAAITKISNTELSVSLTGSATNHDNADAISNLEIAFNNTAFTSGDASSVTFATKSDLSIDFIQSYTVASSGADFTTISAALAAIDHRDIINLAAETFTEAGLFIEKDVSIQGAGADVTIVQAHATQNMASDRVFRAQFGRTVSIDGITIRHGKSFGGAGILSGNRGTVTISNSIITNNNNDASANVWGTIWNDGTLILSNSTISNNVLGETVKGSAIYAQGEVFISNSTITNNNTTSGTVNTLGAIYMNNNPLTISNSTVAHNNCGGIKINQQSTITISNTILSDNNGNDYFMNTNNGAINDNGYNVVENQTYNGTATNWKFTDVTNILYNYKADGTANTAWSRNNVDLSNQNLNLSSTLAENSTQNGTQTLAITDGSFAIEAGLWNADITTDQRGLPRYDPPTIGAFEHQGPNVTWTGTTSNVWNLASNWDGFAIPLTSENVIIPNVVTNPVIGATGTATCRSLTIENAATLSIQSDASGVGSLITNGTLTNNGTVNIQRYVSESVWHLVSSPNNTTTSNIFVDDYLQTWDETTASWTDITEASTALTPVKGYSFWGTPSKAATYTFSGTPNTGNQSLALTYTEVVGYGNDGANLLGNPYPSSIDWSGLDDTWGAVYYWNGTQYATWNDGSATNGGVQYIPPMQGFFIMVSTSGTFSLTNSNRTHEGASAYFKATEELSANSILLEAKSGGLTDELFIRIDNEATEDFELTRDAYKFPSDVKGLSQVYSFAGEKTLSIDVRPETEVIQLGFQNDENGIYSIGIKEISDLTGVKLEDTKTGTFHDLQSSSYEFAWSITDNEKRFKLHLNALGIEDDIAQQDQILIYSSGNTIYFKNLENTKDVQMIISDITGRIVLEKDIQSSGLVSFPTNLKSGIYIVSLINENEIQTEKVIIN